MALFRRRSGGGTAEGSRTGRWGFGLGRREDASASAAPVIDPALGDPGLAALLAHAEALDWEALREGLAAVTDEAELTWVLDRLKEVAGIEKWIPKAVAAEPDSDLPLLLSGARHVAWAWEARTGARAKYVTDEQWETFYERLRIAEEHLYEAAERAPGRLAPWYFLQISARGASHSAEVSRYRFEAALRRHPGDPASHRQRLQQLAAKWGGSHEEMHAFAREAMLAAPEGSPLGELVALAHIEHWLSLDDGPDDAYMADPEVAARLHEAANRSILHPAHRRERGWQAAYNSFALAFSLAGEKAAAHALFETLDGAATEFPWYYVASDAAEGYRRHRDSCAP
ncbi:hypothetical protein ACWEQL_37875 [Kitasatospora sp. NPDC004240]